MSVEFGFVSESVSSDDPFCAIAIGAKDLAIEGGELTTKTAILLGVPGTASVEWDAPLVWLLCVPGTVLVTLKMMVQPAGEGTLPAVTFILVAPATSAGVVTTPVHVPPMTPSNIWRLDKAKLSVNAKPVRAAPVGFEMVIVICADAPLLIAVGAAGVNALAIPNFATLSVALAVNPVPPLVDVIAVVVFE
jgi:hypothetical protein